MESFKERYFIYIVGGLIFSIIYNFRNWYLCLYKYDIFFRER